MPTFRAIPVLGLGGKKRHGKDTLADFLVEHHGFVKIGMSDALHEMALEANFIVGAAALNAHPITYREATNRLGYVAAKEFYPEYTRILQMLGTEIGRKIDDDVWANAMDAKVRWHMNGGDNDEYPAGVVVTGIRYANEFNTIRHLGGQLAYVARLNYEDRPDDHSSEKSLRRELFDVTVENGTLEGLRLSADSIAADLLDGRSIA